MITYVCFIPMRGHLQRVVPPSCYALDTAWWRGNSRVKLAKTTSYIQYRLIQQSQVNPASTYLVSSGEGWYLGSPRARCMVCRMAWQVSSPIKLQIHLILAASQSILYQFDNFLVSTFLDMVKYMFIFAISNIWIGTVFEQ